MSYPRKYPVSGADPHLQAEDWNAMVDFFNGYTPEGTFVGAYCYIISTNEVEGTTYYYAHNAFQLIYGGPDNAGDVDGTDANAVIQTCLNQMTDGTLLFKKGTYTLTAPISITHRVTIIGEGTGSTFFMTSGAISAFDIDPPETASIVNPVFNNFEVKDTDDNLGVNGFYFHRTVGTNEITMLHMENIYVTGFKTGIRIELPLKGVLINCVTEWSHDDKIGIYNLGGLLTIIGHWFEQCTLGIDCRGAAAVTLIDPQYIATTTLYQLTSMYGYVPVMQVIGSQDAYYTVHNNPPYIVVIKEVAGIYLAKYGYTGEAIERDPDAATVIQAAIDACDTRGGTVHLGFGIFDIDTALNMKSWVILEGEGIYATELKTSGAINALNFDTTDGLLINNCIRNMRILDGDGDGVYGVHIYGANECRTLEFLKVQITGFQNSIRFDGTGCQALLIDPYFDTGDIGIYNNDAELTLLRPRFDSLTKGIEGHGTGITLLIDPIWLDVTTGATHADSSRTRSLSFKERCDNRGAATIPNGTSSVVVTHGLQFNATAVTPTCITTTGTTTDTDLLYVDNVGSTTFTIHASDGNVAGDRTVYWQASYDP